MKDIRDVKDIHNCPEKPPTLNGDAQHIWKFLEYLSDELRDVRADLRENRKLTAQLFLILFATIIGIGGSVMGVLLSGVIK